MNQSWNFLGLRNSCMSGCGRIKHTVEKKPLAAVKDGGASIMLWGCLLPLALDGLDSIKYQRIREKNTMLFEEAEVEHLWTFKQDHSPKHVLSTPRFKPRKKFWNITDWSSQSLDLNFTEISVGTLQKKQLQHTNTWILINWRHLSMKSGARFFRNAARSWCLIMNTFYSKLLKACSTKMFDLKKITNLETSIPSHLNEHYMFLFREKHSVSFAIWIILYWYVYSKQLLVCILCH